MPNVRVQIKVCVTNEQARTPFYIFNYICCLGVDKKNSERNGLTLKHKKEQERYGSEYDINPERDEKNGLPLLLLNRNKKRIPRFDSLTLTHDRRDTCIFLRVACVSDPWQDVRIFCVKFTSSFCVRI